MSTSPLGGHPDAASLKTVGGHGEPGTLPADPTRAPTSPTGRDDTASGRTSEEMADVRGLRVLVTGAGGFLGQHAVDRLRLEGADVVALDRAACDLTDRLAVDRAVAAARPDALLHLAAARDASQSAARVSTATVNALSGLWLIEALPETCRSAVRLGSSTEYAASPQPMDELTPLRPRGFFGHTKAAGSLLFAAAAQERGLHGAVLRAFQVYGPADKATRFVPVVLTAARTGRPVDLTGTGLRRDWVYVDDVVATCLRALLANGEPGIATYNIGTGVQTTNEDLVALAEQVTGRRITTNIGAEPGRSWDTPHWVCDPRLANADLGWRATTALSDGLRKCWDAAA